MPQKAVLSYGIDPQKPYTLSLAYFVDYAFNPNDTTMLDAATAQAAVATIAAGNAQLINNINEYVSLMSYAIQGTQGAVVQHFNWTLFDTNGTTDPDDLTPVWSAAAPNYNVVPNAPLQNDVPNVVAGVKLRAPINSSQRLFAWGLLNQAAEDLTFNAILTPGSGQQQADYFYVVQQLVRTPAPAIITGRFLDKIMVAANTLDALYKGVRRA